MSSTVTFSWYSLCNYVDSQTIERVHKQLFSRHLRLRVARVEIEKPWSDDFMKLDGDSKKRYLLKIVRIDG